MFNRFYYIDIDKQNLIPDHPSPCYFITAIQMKNDAKDT